MSDTLDEPTPEITPASGGVAAPPPKTNGSAPIDPGPTDGMDDDLGGFEAAQDQRSVLDDAEDLRLDPNEAINESIKILGPVPVRMNPGKQVFFRVKPGQEWRWSAAIYYDDELGPFIVSKKMRDSVEDVKPFLVLTCITSKGVEFFWPVPIQREDDNAMSRGWGESKRRAADRAQTKWVKIKSNKAAGCWDIFEAKGNQEDPQWSGRSFKEMFDSAFADKIIRDVSHPVIKHQQGL